MAESEEEKKERLLKELKAELVKFSNIKSEVMSDENKKKFLEKHLKSG